MNIGRSKDKLTKLGEDIGGKKTQGTTTMWYSTNKYGYPLEAGTTYYYQAFAIVDGKTVMGNIKSFNTIPDNNPEPEDKPPEPPVVGRPSKPVVSVTQQSVSINWSPVANASSYNVYLVNGQLRWEDIQCNGETADTSYTFENVQPGDYYAFVIARPNENTVQSEWTPVSVKAPQPENSGSGSDNPPPPPPSITLSWETDNNRFKVSQSNATVAVKGTVSNVSTAAITEIGADLYDAAGNRLGGKSEDAGFSGSSSNFYVWYDVNNRFGCTLNANTSYQYQFYAVVNGQRYTSQMFSFTTPQKAGSISWEPDYGRFRISANDATIAVKGTVSGFSTADITEEGIRLYDAAGNYITGKSEPAGFSGNYNYFYVWYHAQKSMGYTLSRGTKYKAQFYAIVNGQTYTSQMFVFTTSN